MISLNKPTTEDGAELGSLIPDESPSNETLFYQNSLRENFAKILKILSPKERTILELHYGLIDGISHTLEEIAPLVGVTSRERVRQLEAKAFLKLKTNSVTGQILKQIHEAEKS